MQNVHDRLAISIVYTYIRVYLHISREFL